MKHRGVVYEVDFDGTGKECPYERLSGMFQIPIDRLKLVQRGKLLPLRGSPKLGEALRTGVIIQLVGSRLEHHLHRDWGIFR